MSKWCPQNFLDKPGKRAQWDPTSLSNCQLDAGSPDFSHRLPGFCSLCRCLTQQTAPGCSYRIVLRGSGPWPSAPGLSCPLITMDPHPRDPSAHNDPLLPRSFTHSDLLRWLRVFQPRPFLHSPKSRMSSCCSLRFTTSPDVLPVLTDSRLPDTHSPLRCNPNPSCLLWGLHLWSATSSL